MSQLSAASLTTMPGPAVQRWPRGTAWGADLDCAGLMQRESPGP